ncbi:MAG: GH25 family lysozyme [Myxococcota bacterium]
MRRLLYASVVLVAAAIGVAALLWQGILWFNMPSRARWPIRGLDVSHHQGAIDWARVDAAAWRFVWIKATEGGDWRDSRFAENWVGARAAGLAPGAYHFYTFCRPAAEQAANFLAVTPDEPNTLPPVVDVEFGGNCAARPTREALLAELAVYADAVEAGLGRRPLLYATGDATRDYQLSGIAWVRDIFWEPAPPWTVWQYGQRGRVDGIDTFVDVNVFGGDAAAFAAFVR